MESTTAYPGKYLCAQTEDMEPGEGTYAYMGKIYAAFKGKVCTQAADWGQGTAAKIQVL